MLESDETKHPFIIAIPEGNSSSTKQPKEPKAVFRPPSIDPQLRLKWGLALLGEERAREYLAWIQARFDAESR